MADMREVDPDLMSAARQQSALDQRGGPASSGPEPPLPPGAGDRRTTAGVRHHRHLFAVMRAAADIADTLASRRKWHAPDDRTVGTLDPPRCEIIGEGAVRSEE